GRQPASLLSVRCATSGKPVRRDRDKVSPVLAVRHLYRLACLCAGGLELGAQTVDLGLERDDAPHTFQVQPGGRELLNAPQVGDVRLAVAAVASPRAGGVQEALALVDAKRLRMDAGQLRRDGDDIDRARRALMETGLGLVVAHVQTPRYSRGEPFMVLARASTALRCSSESSDGTTRSTVTSMSPFELPDVIPWPLTRNV